MTKGEKKDGVLNVFFDSICNSMNNYQGTYSHELECRGGEQNEAQMTQEEIASMLLHHLYIHIWKQVKSTQE